VPADHLRDRALFAALPPDERDRLLAASSTTTFEKGDVLWEAGDAGDAMLIVASGELEVVGPEGEVLGRIGVGEHVGELALLLDEPRSATVRCSVAGAAVCIAKDAFDEIVGDDRVIAVMSAVVARRAARSTRRQRLERRLLLVGVVADRDVSGASLVAAALAERATTLLDRTAVVVAASGDVGATATAARTDHAALDLCVLDVAAGADPAAVRAACDVVVRVVHDLPGEDADDVITVVNQHGRTGAPIVAGPSTYVLTDAPAAAASSRSMDRLVRHLFGVRVGIALGGGAAFGIAHVGVIQALEHAGIEIDVLAGTSMGSIVALGAAGGLSGDAMAEIAGRLGNVRTALSVLDPAVDGSGLLAGRRLVRLFSPLLSVETFDQLERPCRVVATDIDTGDRVDIGSGRLDDAFRASCSIPLVFSPVVLDGRTLVDGAMVDPVPAEVARAMGADIVIGVNVVPRLEAGSTTTISRVFKAVNRFNPLSFRGGGRGLPDVVDVLMSSLQVVQHELGRFRSLAGDVQVDVDLAGFTWIDFHRATDLVARGRAAGDVAVPAVQRAIAERLA